MTTTPAVEAREALALTSGAADRRVILRRYARTLPVATLAAGDDIHPLPAGQLIAGMSMDALASLLDNDADPAAQAAIIAAARARLTGAPIPTPTPEPAPMALPIHQTVPAPVAPVAQAPASDVDALDMLKRGIAALAGSTLDEARVVSLIHTHAPKPDHVTVTVHTTTARLPVTLPDEARHAVFPDVLACIGAGEHVYLVGPAGSGKTTLADQVAKALNLPFRFCGALDSKYALTGFRDAHGHVARTPFRDAYEHGGVFLLDEIDASHPSVPLTLNAALANGHHDFPDAIVSRHPDFRCIAAANTYGAGADRVYVGRNQLDAATLDRFAMIPMDYDEKLEAHIGADRPEWVRRVQAFRAAARKLALRIVVSPRATIRGIRLLAAGLPMERVEEITLWRGMDDATRTKMRDALGRA
jgi:cobaltochelatase CobS